MKVFKLLHRSSDETQHLEEVFEKYDKDKNSTLDREELTHLLHDMYLSSISDAEQKGSFPPSYIQKARAALDSPRGERVIAEAIDDLLMGDDSLTREAFFDRVANARRQFEKSEFWTLAPLLQIRVNIDTLVDPWFTEKVFIAGGISGGLSKTVSSPFSRVSILQQTQVLSHPLDPPKNSIQLSLEIFRNEGLRGFFVGNLADVFRGVLFAGINFVVYEKCKAIFNPYDSTESKTISKFTSGGLAGVASVLTSYPLDIIRTRLTVQSQKKEHYNGIMDAFSKIVKNEGVRGLWTGAGVSCVQVFPKMAINYSSYEYCKKHSREYLPELPNETLRQLLCGSISGLAANGATFPLEVVIRNMQVQSKNASEKVSGWGIIRQIMGQQGPRGFYRGFLPQVIKSIPTIAVTLATYDKMKQYLNLDIVQ